MYCGLMFITRDCQHNCAAARPFAVSWVQFDSHRRKTCWVCNQWGHVQTKIKYMPLLTSECCDDIMRRSKGFFFDLHIIQWMSWSTKKNSTFKTEIGTKRAWTNSKNCAKWRSWPSSLRTTWLKCQARNPARMRSKNGWWWLLLLL